MKLELEQYEGGWNVVDEKGRGLFFETVSLALAYIHQEEQEELRKSKEVLLKINQGQLEFMAELLKCFKYGYANDDERAVFDEVDDIIHTKLSETKAIA